MTPDTPSPQDMDALAEEFRALGALLVGLRIPNATARAQMLEHLERTTQALAALRSRGHEAQSAGQGVVAWMVEDLDSDGEMMGRPRLVTDPEQVELYRSSDAARTADGEPPWYRIRALVYAPSEVNP